MSRRRSRGRSAPPEADRAGEDGERDDTPPLLDDRPRDVDDDPSRREGERGGATASGGATNQEAMRAAVLEALSDPAIVRQLLSAVSSSSSASLPTASTSAHDGKWNYGLSSYS